MVRTEAASTESLAADLGPLARRPTVELIAEALRDRIIEGSFPPGAQLGEVQLAAQLQVSRGPLREAIQRLVQEGLLVARPHRGVFVIQLDESDVADVYLARRVIEQTAASLVVARPAPVLLNRLDKLVSRMAVAAERQRWAQVVRLDQSFHQALVDGAGSPRLSRMFSTLLVETAVCMGALENAYPIRKEVVDEHRELVDALRSGHEATVLACVGRHLDHAVAHLTARGAPTAVS